MPDRELTAEMSATAAITEAVVWKITDEQLSWWTPCAGYDVSDLLNHLMGVFTVAERAGRKAPEAGAAMLYLDRMGEGWRERFAILSTAAVQPWTTAQAWQGQTALLGRTFQAAAAGRRLLGELVVHGWDLATALGVEYEPDPSAVRAVHAYFADSLADGRNPIAWGPAVPVPETAPMLHRLLGLSGRHPSWPRAGERPAMNAWD